MPLARRRKRGRRAEAALVPRPGPTDHQDFASLLEARARAAGAKVGTGTSRRPSLHVETVLGSGRETSRPADASAMLSQIYAEDSIPAAEPPPPACDPETIAGELRLAS